MADSAGLWLDHTDEVDWFYSIWEKKCMAELISKLWRFLLIMTQCIYRSFFAMSQTMCSFLCTCAVYNGMDVTFHNHFSHAIAAITYWYWKPIKLVKFTRWTCKLESDTKTMLSATLVPSVAVMVSTLLAASSGCNRGDWGLRRNYRTALKGEILVQMTHSGTEAHVPYFKIL